jgi:ribosomal protein S18 acetylase RimI-like enzyme
VTVEQRLHDALDRPVWSALTGPQAALAQGDVAALRIDPGYGPFAASAPGQEAALAALLRDGDDEIWLIEDQDLSPPAGTVVRKTARLAQMVAVGPVEVDHRLDFVPLGQADVPAMTALAMANRPGPWGPSTWQYGQFYGVWRNDRLIAMAGERLRPAFVMIEVSGVCTDPAFRGQGLAGRLIRQVMAGHRARGAASFLHSYADNAGAIALYRSLGFVLRRERVVTILGKA